MTIWIMTVLLFAVFGVLGYVNGAVRTMFPLAGLVIGALLAVPLGPWLEPLVPLVGLKNPIWSMLLPPALVFFLISILFVALGFVAHWKVNLFFKYRTDDYHRLTWDRLNRRLGISIGLLAGAGYTILLGLVVYILGYLTVQVSAGENEKGLVKILNQARADLRSTGLEKTVAAFDPAPEDYYRAADILGLLYHNRLLGGRLAGYPDVLSLAERQEFLDISNDAEFQNLLASQSTLGEIVAHPKTQAILSNPEIRLQLEGIDLNDLLAFLRTGDSQKYADVRILGRWQLDPYGTLIQQKRLRQRTITASDIRELMQRLELIKGYTVAAMPDNSASLRGQDVVQVMRDSQTPDQQGTPSSPTAIAQQIASMPIGVLARGNWEREGNRYRLSLEPEVPLLLFGQGRRTLRIDASIRENRLYLTNNNEVMVMAKY